MRMMESTRYLFVSEFARQTPMAIVSGRVLKASQISKSGELALDGRECSRGFVTDLVKHKNYEYVICKTNSKITRKSQIGKTITVHIEKEVWHGEKTRSRCFDSSPHGTNFAATLKWSRTNPNLPS